MALLLRTPSSQAYRDNQHLQQFILTGVTPTEKILGRGSYGLVLEVKYQHLVCAAKKLHEALLEVGNEGVENVILRYQQECQLMASLRHPNITQFLGLCFLPGTQLPLLVMERLEMSLDDLLESVPNLPHLLKISFMENVCSGLVYLHSRQPTIIHRDLTAKNVLLTSSLVAKITDMGNSRIVNMRPCQLARTLSQLPGTLVYMPPEALGEVHRYGASLDIFSFGHLSLYTLTQIFPGDILSSTYPDPNDPEHTLARSEVERRQVYMERLEAEVGLSHPALVQLVRQCLHNAPGKRPSSEELLGEVQRVRVEVERVYGGSVVKQLDIGKVLLAKEMKTKERRIEEMEERCLAAEGRIKQLEISRDLVEAENRELERVQERDKAMQKVQLQQLQQEKDEALEEMGENLQHKDKEIQTILLSMHSLEESLIQLRVESEVSEAGLKEDLQVKHDEISRLTEQLRKCQKLLGSAKEIENVLSSVKLTKDAEMPFRMTGYIQSVLVKGTLYVGGGDTRDGDNDYTVMAYNTRTHIWHQLPPYETNYFAVAVIDNQLVLVGGSDYTGDNSKQLGTWEHSSSKWTHPYPPMPTARSSSSAVGYGQWLIVAGGSTSHSRNVSRVELLDVDNKQWYSAPPTPTPWSSMKSTIVGDMWYLMGGFNDCGSTDTVYSVSLPSLVSLANSESSDSTPANVWKSIQGLGCYYSTPVCIHGSLLALGGRKTEKIELLSTIRRYLPGTEEWVTIGSLQQAIMNCTCALVSDGKILVVGGYDSNDLKG